MSVSGTDYVALGSLAVAMLVAARGYLSHPVLAPAARLDALREELTDCRSECGELRARLKEAEDAKRTSESKLRGLKLDIEWWQDRCKSLQMELDKRQK